MTSRAKQKAKSPTVKKSRDPEGVGNDITPTGDPEVKSGAELLEALPEKVRKQFAKIIMQTSHSGPLPSAAELQRYQEILPDLGERIVRMAEKEQDSRHKIENRSINAYNLRNSFSFLLGIGLIGSSIIALSLGYPMAAIPLGVIGVVGAVLNTIIKMLTRASD